MSDALLCPHCERPTEALYRCLQCRREGCLNRGCLHDTDDGDLICGTCLDAEPTRERTPAIFTKGLHTRSPTE